ncbi:MAG TPA: hypothetical protein VHV10_10880 [Ktedonobacteraceae bacterium]|nr:hypothetical protein [Ktedonobacteraceae bacterium]
MSAVSTSHDRRRVLTTNEPDRALVDTIGTSTLRTGLRGQGQEGYAELVV